MYRGYMWGSLKHKFLIKAVCIYGILVKIVLPNCTPIHLINMEYVFENDLTSCLWQSKSINNALNNILK